MKKAFATKVIIELHVKAVYNLKEFIFQETDPRCLQ